MGALFLLIGLIAAPSFAGDPAPDPFTDYLAQPFPAADGFDDPVNETRGGGQRVARQPIRAVAHGRVVVAKDFGHLWGKVIVVEHLLYENHEKRTIRSVYARLDRLLVEVGQVVRRRQAIGSIDPDPETRALAQLHFELRSDEAVAPAHGPPAPDGDRAESGLLPPAAFIQGHRRLYNPATEAHLVLVDQSRYAMRIYRTGTLQVEFGIGLGQAVGAKQRRGDLKTPKGMYFVVHKHRGSFSGRFAAYFGGHWIKINYPNASDAQRALAAGWVDRRTAQGISSAWAARAATAGNTPLGGGIGFHGWIGPWDPAEGRHLSWGCIVMHNPDIQAWFARIPIGAMVVIF